MAIEYVGGQTQLLGTSATTITFSLTGGISATPTSGDVVIVTIGVASTSDKAIGVLSPAGYTELNQAYVNDVFDTNMSTSWKRMGTTPDTSVTVTGATSADGRVAVIQVFRGVDATQPFDASIATSTAPNTAIVNPSAVVPNTPGSIIVISGAAAHNQFVLGTFSAPYLSNFISGISSTTNDLTVGMGYVAWTSGVYDPAAWTFGGTNSANFSNASITMALRPAASSGITGTASGTADVTGSASASVAVSAAGSGTVSVTGSAAGSVAASASADGTVTITGAASGAVLVSAQAAGDVSVTGAAVGAVLVDAQASGSASITGAASGAVAVSAVMAGAISVSGEASAAVQVSAAGSGEATVTGSATGTVGDSGITGAASGEASVTGTAVGAVQVSADAAGEITVTGAAVAAVSVTAEISGTATITGQAAVAVSSVTSAKIAVVVNATRMNGCVQAIIEHAAPQRHSLSGHIVKPSAAGRVSRKSITSIWRAV